MHVKAILSRTAAIQTDAKAINRPGAVQNEFESNLQRNAAIQTDVKAIFIEPQLYKLM